ncbi:MAG: CinA family nicotinamide mononucleotide deamidase-related protein [Bacteroidales bacterium]|nr:CinA family nicotinamide mononucleotide deamidase-related protein [Bacteroidales bacterium]
MLKASICTIGDELLIGQVIDTNSASISRAVGAIGVKVTGMVSIPDDRDRIISDLKAQLAVNDIVISTGGLGPTKDDITKQALAELSGTDKYYMHEGQLAIVHEILKSRGLDVLDINRQQAMVPESCEVLLNKRGTAPIMVFRGLGKGNSTLYAMPGVPFETEAALPDVVEDIRAHYPTDNITHRNLMTYGLAESALAKKISDWEDSLPKDVHLAYLPDPLKGVRLRLSIYSGSKEVEKSIIDSKIAELSGIIGDYIYSYEDDTLEGAIGRILKEKNLTLSAAESCTGGEIAHLITTVPGSSAYFLGSVTSYAVKIKENVLGVPAETIEKHGVVSSETACAMASGVRKLTGSDYAVSTTGYAGPGGGNEKNPEGTVWVGIATPNGVFSEKFCYKNDRRRNIQRFAASALFTLLKRLKQELN